LLRLRSDEQLLSMFREGRDDAFDALHSRYQPRLQAYARTMLRSDADVDDVLQDVFLRAYRALRADDRPVLVRAWLYRVAHNRCIDEVRRPQDASAIVDDALPGGVDPVVEFERRAELRQLVRDLQALPDQQRSALIIRELEGVSYEELAETLQATVPAVKSLLVRARMGLAKAAQARSADCAVIREEITLTIDRGVGGRPSGLVRDHVRECADCRAHRDALRRDRARLAALLPGPSTLLLGGWIASLLGGAGGAGGGAAGGAAAGGAAAGGAAGATGIAAATKVLVVASASVAVAGGAVEAARVVHHPAPSPEIVSAPSDFSRAGTSAGAQPVAGAPLVSGDPSARLIGGLGTPAPPIGAVSPGARRGPGNAVGEVRANAPAAVVVGRGAPATVHETGSPEPVANGHTSGPGVPGAADGHRPQDARTDTGDAPAQAGDASQRPAADDVAAGGPAVEPASQDPAPVPNSLRGPQRGGTPAGGAVTPARDAQPAAPSPAPTPTATPTVPALVPAPKPTADGTPAPIPSATADPTPIATTAPDPVVTAGPTASPGPQDDASHPRSAAMPARDGGHPISG
jgi:RNA polymerase sigma factor (sigma-70 family)